MKLRLPGRRDHAGTTDTPDASADLTEQLVQASGKGRPTPKRSEAQGRRQGPPPPPPTTRKEAYKRMRAQQAAQRGEVRRGAARGDEAYLPARDRAETSAPTATDASADLTDQLVRAAGKGRPTPKRSEAQGRRPGPPPPPPTTRKEAYKRMRAQQAAQRGDARRAAARGDDSFLPARDRGPVRRTVREVVDSRRNVGSWFLAIAGVALVGAFYPSLAVKAYSSYVLMGFFLLLVVDSVVLSRRIKRKVAERFPNTDHSSRGLVWYGISRSTMIRRWRFPKPDVALGADV